MSDQDLINAAQAPNIAYSKKDWDAFKAAVTPGYVYDEVATHRKLEGIDAVMPAVKGWATAFPDSAATHGKASVSGNTVVLELTWRGTQTGPLQSPNGEIPATGKSIEMRACQVVEIEDGKVASARQYFDMATMMQQLGLS